MTFNMFFVQTREHDTIKIDTEMSILFYTLRGYFHNKEFATDFLGLSHIFMNHKSTRHSHLHCIWPFLFSNSETHRAKHRYFFMTRSLQDLARQIYYRRLALGSSHSDNLHLLGRETIG